MLRLGLPAPAAFTALTGNTPPAGDSSTNAATTAALMAAIGGVAPVSTTGGSQTLTPAQYGLPVLRVTGALTSAATLVVPNSGVWLVLNRTTGAFALTVKTVAGTGIAVSQGYSDLLAADGTNVVMGDSDLAGAVITGGTIDGTPIGNTTPASAKFTFIAASNNFTLSAAAGTYRGFYWQSNGLSRVSAQIDSTAESGSNAGSNFQFNVFDDTGAIIGTAIGITRATAAVSLPNVVITGGSVNGASIGGASPAAGTFTSLNSTGYVYSSGATALSAAGTTQATATAITKTNSVFTTVASGAGAVLPNLPPVSSAFAEFTIFNAGANALLLYPASSLAINALAANAALSVAAGAAVRGVQHSTAAYRFA